MGMFASAQTRLALYEEFTGENCPPCASTNPGLDALLAQPANTANTQCIKWQVAIPSAPSATWSLYQTNITEINWRDNYYSISSAPSAKMDGQNVTVFGASSNHPANLNSTHIANAAAVATPFSILLNTSWDANFNNAVVTVTIASSGTFNAIGALKFRLVLIEKAINFATAPGTNGEKDFHWVVRKSFPDIQNGTALPASWTAAQVQTYTINCAVPSYVVDKGQMQFVGFIQDDGDKKVWQTQRGTSPAIPNEAKAMAAVVSTINCNPSITPSVTIKNNGANAITDMTITPYLNAVAGTDVTWTGNLAIGATTTIPMNAITPGAGSNTYSFNISGVSGGDLVMTNNSKSTMFLNVPSYNTGTVTEGFQNVTYPPTGWALFNFDGNSNTFQRSTAAGGFGASNASTRMFVNAAGNGLTDYLVLPPTSLTGTINPQITFDLAYAKVSASNNDALAVQVSTDCGNSWNNVYYNSGTTMTTAPSNSATVFVPTSTQWTAVAVSLMAYANNPGILVRFAVTPNYGNCLYLDNINLKELGNVGINTIEAVGFGFDLFPNPATTDVNLRINSATASKAKVSVVNAIGQVIYQEEVSLNQGTTALKIDSKNFAGGFYNVMIESNNTNLVKKLTITK